MRDPYLDKGMRGWIFNTARKNFYRIAGCDIEDLVQEGYLIFYKCKRHYVGPKATGYNYKGPLHDGGVAVKYLPENPDDPDNPRDRHARAHFKAIFKRAFMNRIYDLAQKQSSWREPALLDLLLGDTDQFGEPLVLPDELTQAEELTTYFLIKEAPWIIRRLLAVLIDQGIQQRHGGTRRYGKGRRAPRETSNTYWCRLLGLDPSTDLEGMVKQHFMSK